MDFYPNRTNVSGDGFSGYATPGKDFLTFVKYHKYAMVVLYTAMSVSNTATVAAFIKCRHLRKQRNATIASLSVADLTQGIYGLVAILWEEYGTVKGCFSPIQIYSMRLFSACFFVVSIFNLIMIGLDRFVAITFPLRYPSLITQKTTTAMVVLTWAVPIPSFALCFLGAIGKPVNDCSFGGRITPELIQKLITTTVYFVVAVTLVALYAAVLYQARNQADGNSVLSDETSSRKINYKAVRFVTVVLVVFMVACFPFVLHQLLSLFKVFVQLVDV